MKQSSGYAIVLKTGCFLENYEAEVATRGNVDGYRRFVEMLGQSLRENYRGIARDILWPTDSPELEALFQSEGWSRDDQHNYDPVEFDGSLYGGCSRHWKRPSDS